MVFVGVGGEIDVVVVVVFDDVWCLDCVYVFCDGVV